MRFAPRVALTVLALSTSPACGSKSDGAHPSVLADDAGDGVDAADSGATDASEDVDKSAPCVGTFGSALTAAFGRLDGTVIAVLPPNDQTCPDPNSTHLIIEVMMGGAAYRMVVDVISTDGSADLLDEVDAPLAGGPWQDGWHDSAVLDYVSTLAVHSTSFVSTPEASLVGKITSEIDLGAHISVFATSGGAADEPNSAHLVHRNVTGQDGAIVIGPDSTLPHYLLLSLSDQTF
jgi:hypothetical protein